MCCTGRRTKIVSTFLLAVETFLCSLRKAALPLLRHGNKVFSLKSILATSRRRWRPVILLTRPWLSFGSSSFLCPPPRLLPSSFAVTGCWFVFPTSLPPPPSSVSDETRHFSWDAILIAVLRLKRLPRSPITLRPVRTFSSRIFSSCSQLSIRLAKALLRRRKLICSGWQARLSVWQIDHRLVDCANLKKRRMQKNAHNYLNIFFFIFSKERSSWWMKILKRSFHLKVRFILFILK